MCGVVRSTALFGICAALLPWHLASAFHKSYNVTKTAAASKPRCVNGMPVAAAS